MTLAQECVLQFQHGLRRGHAAGLGRENFRERIDGKLEPGAALDLASVLHRDALADGCEMFIEQAFRIGSGRDHAVRLDLAPACRTPQCQHSVQSREWRIGPAVSFTPIAIVGNQSFDCGLAHVPPAPFRFERRYGARRLR